MRPGAVVRAAHLVAEITGQHAPGRQHGGNRRNDDALDLELARQVGCVQPGRAAKAEHGEFPGIDTTPQGHQADAVGHLQIDHAVDAGSRFDTREPERRRHAIDGGFRSSPIQRPRAAHEGRGIEITEHDIGVRHRRGKPAIAVARRPRHRARAFRSHPQCAAAVDAGDRAATRRDARDVEASQCDALSRQHAVGGKRSLPFRNQRDVGRGAAHVERHEIGDADEIGAAPAAGHATRRARQHGAGGKPRGFLHRGHAAMRQHDKQATLEAGLDQPLFQIGQIAPHHRLDIGVHHRSRNALIFLDLRQHVAGTRDVDAGQGGAQPLDRRKLMRGVEIGMQETHGDGICTRRLHHIDRRSERALIERDGDAAVGLEPFAHAEAAFARHQRLWWWRAQIVTVGLEAFAHLEHVAVAFGGEQRDLGAFALQ